MKVLMINGSCNEQGCTYTALSEVAKVLNNEGIETEIIQLGKAAYRDCIGCGTCRKLNNRCVFNDDIINQIIEKLKRQTDLFSALRFITLILPLVFRLFWIVFFMPAAAYLPLNPALPSFRPDVPAQPLRLTSSTSISPYPKCLSFPHLTGTTYTA